MSGSGAGILGGRHFSDVPNDGAYKRGKSICLNHSLARKVKAENWCHANSLTTGKRG